jgi:hypothetical protein
MDVCECVWGSGVWRGMGVMRRVVAGADMWAKSLFVYATRPVPAEGTRGAHIDHR